MAWKMREHVGIAVASLGALGVLAGAVLLLPGLLLVAAGAGLMSLSIRWL